MPPHQTNLTAEPAPDAARLGINLAMTLVNDATGRAPAAPRPDLSIAALRESSSEKDAAGPPATPTWMIIGLIVGGWIVGGWRAFQEWRRRESLRATLYDLSERELMDIGINSAEIDYITLQRDIEALRDGTVDQRALFRRGM